MSTAIHWFRRDFRLTDNTALNAAAAAHDQVVPVYIVSTWKRQHRWTGPPRQEFLCGCLEELARNLAAGGGRLIIRRGRADEELEKLARECGAEAIYFNRDPDPFGRAMEQRVAAMAEQIGVAAHAHKDIALHEREEVLTGSREPFRVFTPYATAWRKLPKPTPRPAITRLATPPHLNSLPVPTLATWELQSTAKVIESGEGAARQRLENLLEKISGGYGESRNFPAAEKTSRISQDLRHGLLSIREVYAQLSARSAAVAAAERQNIETLINELVWREFYMQVLWFRPDVLDQEYQEDRRSLSWQPAGEQFERWRVGETGFPIIDAGMRQLTGTGFLHNRVRMIVAMFLTKDLHVSWKAGEQWFMQGLVDAEIASNNGGWQWSASTGTDAAPYFRIQNPWLQAKRFDPDGEYIKRWLPELREVPTALLFRPPASGQRIAPRYPLPMVDHAKERDVALEMFRK
jgi:deoxyribodipyrimidine photo-lyase